MAARLGRVNAAKAINGGHQLQQVRFSGGMQALKIRMKSIQNVAKITKAQQMVASAKLRGAEAALNAGRPFAKSVDSLFGSLAKSEDNPEGVEFSPKKVAVVGVSSDKGMCGSINTNVRKKIVNKLLPEAEAKGVDVSMVSVGGKMRNWVRKMNPDELTAVVSECFKNPPNFSLAAAIAEQVVDSAPESTTIVFNKYINMGTQEVQTVEVPSYSLISEMEDDPFMLFETEDERSEVLESFAEFNVMVSLYGTLLENRTSEFASKMQAMDNATRNANDIFDRLELKYNKARQAAITTELVEIISGAESLKG
jgi:ATP synthase F1 gamma subunit